MIKFTKKYRKIQRVENLLLYKNIPYGYYCGICIYKRYITKHDTFILTNTRYKRYVVWCKLDKNRTIDDVCMSDGLKICSINEP